MTIIYNNKIRFVIGSVKLDYCEIYYVLDEKPRLIFSTEEGPIGFLVALGNQGIHFRRFNRIPLDYYSMTSAEEDKLVRFLANNSIPLENNFIPVDDEIKRKYII